MIAVGRDPRPPGGRAEFIGLLRQWVVRDWHGRYRRSALRALWAVVQPALVVGTYAFVFGVIFDQSGGSIPFLTFLLAGFTVYRLVAGALGSLTCLVDSADLLGHSRFPVEVIPVSRVVGSLGDTAIMVTGLVVVASLQGVAIPLTIVALPLVMFSAVVLACAWCLLASTVQVFVRDLEFLMGFVVTALFFACPIAYEPDQLPPALRWLNVVNPVSVNIETVRDVALRGDWPGALFYVHLAGAVILLVGAVAYLRSLQHRMVDLV